MFIIMLQMRASEAIDFSDSDSDSHGYLDWSAYDTEKAALAKHKVCVCETVCLWSRKVVVVCVFYSTPSASCSIIRRFCSKDYHWHIQNILKSNENVHNQKELGHQVLDAKLRYFDIEDYNRTYTYLKSVGAVLKVGRCLRWKECSLTPANMEFLKHKSMSGIALLVVCFAAL
jgi:hypothetical protein